MCASTLDFKIYFNFDFVVCLGILPVCMSVHLYRVQKRLLDGLGLELQTIVSHRLGSGY